MQIPPETSYLIACDFTAPGRSMSRVHVGSVQVEALTLIANPELMRQLVRELRDNVIRTEGGSPTGIAWTETWYRAVVDPETGTAPEESFHLWETQDEEDAA
jgi:hypothetical protein